VHDEQRIRSVFETRRDVVAVYLFGSVARGTAGPASDIDIAALFTTAPAATLDGPRLTLEGDLERALGRSVDFVVLNGAPVDLRIRILRDGRLLLDRDPAARIAYEVRTRNEAFDLEPVLARYRAPRAGQT
jgi:predicted nucleotidyltransferase